MQSEKKKDADAFIINFVKEYQPRKLFLDAPLSLPAAYFGKGDDFFYRSCDRETRAMSPMFLGGLTARAMRLRSELFQVDFFETYPAFLVKEVLELKESYNKKTKDDSEFLDKLLTLFQLELKDKPSNWHQVDALLCWISGKRHAQENHREMGNVKEGLIIV